MTAHPTSIAAIALWPHRVTAAGSRELLLQRGAGVAQPLTAHVGPDQTPEMAAQSLLGMLCGSAHGALQPLGLGYNLPLLDSPFADQAFPPGACEALFACEIRREIALPDHLRWIKILDALAQLQNSP